MECRSISWLNEINWNPILPPTCSIHPVIAITFWLFVSSSDPIFYRVISNNARLMLSHVILVTSLNTSKFGEHEKCLRLNSRRSREFLQLPECSIDFSNPSYFNKLIADVRNNRFIACRRWSLRYFLKWGSFRYSSIRTLTSSRAVEFECTNLPTMLCKRPSLSWHQDYRVEFEKEYCLA